MDELIDVSIIIVNYNTCDMLSNCLDSIRAYTKDINYEVIVIDNASTDNSCLTIKEKYKWVKLIESSQNIGFGKANNIGFKAAQGKTILLLNTDTLLIDNSIKILYDFLQSNLDTGVCGGLLLNPDLTPSGSYGHKLSFSRELSSFFKPFLSKHIPDTRMKIKEVDYITGADMMIKKDVIAQTHGFDPDFFLYWEETEWSHRIWQSGYKIKFAPQARIIHLEGMSGFAKPELNPMITKEKWFSRFLYFHKVYSDRYSTCIYCLHLVRCQISNIIFFILQNKKKILYWKNKQQVISSAYTRYKNFYTYKSTLA